jgi:hypothetical protein
MGYTAIKEYIKSLQHDRMTALSDTLTIGLVLVLLFGSIALYLYTRIQQAEQKISLLESILLDLKMSGEIKSYSELPAPVLSEAHSERSQEIQEYEPFEEEIEEGVIARNPSPASSVSSEEQEVEFYKSVVNDVAKEEIEIIPTDKLSVNYESMTIKELQGLAKQRGITNATTMKKGQLVQVLKTSDKAMATPDVPEAVESGSSSFLETSSFLE